MASGLLNVRLDRNRRRKASTLRRHGVVLSDLVRQAIDARFDELTQATPRRDPDAIVQGILNEHPDPPDLVSRGYDVHDRKQARTAVARRLRRGVRRAPR